MILRFVFSVFVFLGIAVTMMFIHPLWIHGINWHTASFWATDGFILFRYGVMIAIVGAVWTYAKLK